MAHGVAPERFNWGTVIFLPKGDCLGDEVLVKLTAERTRPITLSNSANKVVSFSLNQHLSYICTVTCVLQQR
eukprot:9474699-Pyramimonas_sp.AAC.1